MKRLRVVIPYAKLHPIAEVSIDRHVPNSERRLLVGDEGYWRLLVELWRSGESFALIEQDIEIHSRVAPALADCRRRWCLFPYPGPLPARGWSQTGGQDDPLLYRSLGATKFSGSLLRAEPGFIECLEERDWRTLDSQISPGLIQLGYKPHIHYPPVSQHHVWAGVCSCGTEHESYPVDDEGRYCG